MMRKERRGLYLSQENQYLFGSHDMPSTCSVALSGAFLTKEVVLIDL